MIDQPSLDRRLMLSIVAVASFGVGHGLVRA